MPLAELHPNAPEGHVATRCVAEQGPQLFWSLHDDLFSRQEEWRNLPSPTEFLAAAAEKAGADPAAYRRCVDAGVQKAFVDASLARATTGLGFSGTPSFRFIQSAALAGKADPASKGPKTFELVGAYPLETFAAWLDALLAGQEPPGYRDPNAPAKPETLPAWASPEGLAPDPARPGFTAAGDPYRGSPKAGVTVVAFSNFQCSHCRTHALDVQPAVDKAFVDTGKVRWVSKNLPLRNLPQSTVAAVAAECAGEQGHYWPMYRLLFETQRQWSVPDPEPVFRQLAGRVGADGGAFAACYNSRQALEGVLEDMYAASGVVSEAPAFVFVFGGKAAVLRGSKPAADFVRTVQGILDQAAGGQGAAAAPDAQAPATTTSTTP
jgi:protein-disulfide isomerase